MPSYNKTILVGHLGRDVELKSVGSAKVGKSVIAVNRNYQKGGEWQSDTMWLDFELWNEQAERFADRAGKGTAVLLEGRLAQDQWEDKDGNKRSKHKLSVDRYVVFKADDEKAKPQQSKQRGGGKKSQADNDVYQPVPDDDIPF